ncbi:hypothetical protein NDU88_006875 [Pleurodeles waltl]|uniref:Uncharacterized protein n=1 Tax=Pleurodeles waltl TaxID=8319 RepID=A0AAV7RPA5_PLEWA|nr:hypothetical protein NDU88_006875 [Pleurodeles waltl]
MILRGHYIHLLPSPNSELAAPLKPAPPPRTFSSAVSAAALRQSDKADAEAWTSTATQPAMHNYDAEQYCHFQFPHFPERADSLALPDTEGKETPTAAR